MRDTSLHRPEKLPSRPAPLIGIAVSVIIGIIIARYNLLPISVFLAGMIAAAILSGILLFFQKPADNHTFICERNIVILLCIAFACAAGARYKLIYHYFPEDHIVTHCKTGQSRLATLGGTIITQPYIAKSDGFFAEYDFIHAPRTIFALRCSEVLGRSGWLSAGGLCHVTVKQPSPTLRLGQKVQLHCRLTTRGGPHNPGQFDPSDYQRATRSITACFVGSADAITIAAESVGRKDPPDNPLYNLRRKLQNFAQSALIEDISLDDSTTQADIDSRAFLTALLLGQRGQLSPHLYDTFIRTGTVHFLSVSGLHVGIIAGFIWGLGWLLRLPRFWHGLLTVIVIAAYMLLIPPRPPVIRAGIICGCFCLAFMARRTTSPLNILSFAAILILLLRPLDLFNAGFQLSFIVVIGLILFVPVVYHRRFFIDSTDFTFAGVVPVPADITLPWWKRLLRYFLRCIWGLFVVAIVAWLLALPLTAWHFHRIAPWAVIGSVLLYPLIGLALLLGMTWFLFTAAFGIFSTLLAEPLTALSHLIISLTEILSHLPYSNINMASPPIWLMAFFYLLLFWAAWHSRRNGFIPRIVVYTLMIWITIFVWTAPFCPDDQTGKTTRIDTIAIGHGTAVVLRLSDGKTIMYDCGSMTSFNACNNIVVPFLRCRGIQRIDALFISHPNIDHYNGVIDLCRAFDVGTVYLNEYFPKNADYTARKLLDVLKEMNHPIAYLSRGHQLRNIADLNAEQPGYTIDVLWPPRVHQSCSLNKNDSSLTLRISDGDRTILLCGDIGRIPQQALLEMEPPSRLKADILLLPHHGSPVSTLPDFVQAVDPEFCLNSNGKMRKGTLDRLNQLLPEEKIAHTSKRGAISAILTQNAIQIRTFH